MEYGLVVMGASLGGLHSVGTVLSALSAAFPLPVVVAQHRLAEAGDALQQVLQGRCALHIVEAVDKQPIVTGTVYLAPAGYHLLIEQDHLALSTEDPVAFAQPSVDVLFETAARAFRQKTVGVVMTGSGHDGAAGLLAIRSFGGLAIIESPETAEAPEMPISAQQAVPDAVCLSSTGIGAHLAKLSLQQATPGV